MMRTLIALLVCLILAGCGDETTMDLVNRNKHEALINEFKHRGYWDGVHNKDFILRVEYDEGGVTFCPHFIVHLVGREENYPKDMDMVIMNRYGLKEE